MSWEWDEREERCPCGKGTVLVRSGSDDWGRSEHEEEMKCPTCRDRFVYAPLRARADRSWGWIPKADYERRQAALEAEERRREELTTSARARHGAALVAALSRYTSRKAVWEALQGAGCTAAAGWSFTAFNRAVREKGRDAAIRELIDARNEAPVVKLIAQHGARKGGQL